MHSNEKIYVTGHLNPDSDSIASAIGYAFFKRCRGIPAVACRLGALNPETKWLLDRFGFDAPLLLKDARKTLREIELDEPSSVNEHATLYEVIQKMDQENRPAFGVVDDHGILKGMITRSDLARIGLGDTAFGIELLKHTSIEAMAKTVSGTIIYDDAKTHINGKVSIIALTADRLENYEITDEEIENKITDKTKIVGITHVSNVLGTINNVKKIIKYAHKKGAVVIVDASQSIPHMKIDVQDLDADFLVFSGHKMLAPLGIGVLYGKREILNKMTPFLMGGDMIEYVYEQETTFAPLPNKFEAGTQNVEGVIGLGAAIDYIENLGYDKIQEIEHEVISYARQELSKLDYLTLYTTPNEENHSSVISFNIKGVHPHDVASILDSEGVCVRSGNHCAQPLMRFLGIDSTCRASFYIYNTKEDVDKLVKALDKAYNMFKNYIK